MSFGNTKTPRKPTGEAKYQIPMRATPESNGVKTYVLEGDLKKKFIKLFPKNSNRRMMEWFGISFSTVQRFKNELGLKKDMKAIRRQQIMDVKKTCEENGYYDSLRGKPVSEACKEGSRRLRASGFCPMRALKKKNPRRFKAVIRRRAEARKELWRKERLREEYGLDCKTKLRLSQRPITSSAASFKFLMIHKRNYFAVPGHTWWIAYDSETDRSERSEATARKHGFEIIEGEDDDSPDTSK
jgi:hypothetical protein|nr:MAG TPA: hypothetical protein [Caudoviricetes sp.]